jgi:aspartyl-tRNA(Asn)/glutamyl-tRNA(Gln) amidotransferase subunit A
MSDCLEAIENLDGKINAYVTVNEKAMEEAKAADGQKRGKDKPLLGIPIAVKDLFLTVGIRTTASSKVLENFMPQFDSTVVRLLKEAGAIIIGKTNTDAWAHGSSTETSDFGTSKNPWNLDYSPGGSSGGSGAAVMADMCLAAIGSETAGSIRIPAAWNGCVGLKPTYGRVSRYGEVAMGSSLDCPGPMTKTVEDAALLLEILGKKDPYDATTAPEPTQKYSEFLGKDLKGMKIGVAKEYFVDEMNPEAKKLVEESIEVLKDLGAKIEMISTMDPKYAISVYTVIQRSEVSSNLSRYDGIRYGGTRDLMGQEAKRRIMLGTYSLSTGYADKYYKKAQKVRTLFINDFERLFKKYDLIIGPSSPGPALKVGASKGAAIFGEIVDMLMEPSTIAGLPGINVPCGFVDGMPIGLDLFAPQFKEGLVLQAADAYERATDWHKMKPELSYGKK